MNVIEVTKDEDEYEQMLTEIYGTVEVCRIKFDSGAILRELDPIAFRCGLADQPFTYRCGECKEEHDTIDDAEGCCKSDDDNEEL